MANLQELESALVKADQAGNTEDARALAGEIRRLRTLPAQSSSVPTVMGSAEDDQRRLAQGGKTFDQQDQIAQGEADAYQSKVDALNRQEGTGRAMGIGGRAMWRGLAAIPDIVMAPASRAINQLLSADQQTMSISQFADTAMDKLGAPRPQTTAERIGSETTSSLTGAMVPIGLGNTLAGSASRVLSGVGETLRASPLMQLMGGATAGASAQTAREAGASPTLQLLAGLGGGLAPATLSSLGALGLRGLARGQSGEAMQSNLDAFSGVGTSPSAGQAAGNTRMQGLENLLSQGPTSVGRMSGFAAKQATEIGDGLQANAEGLYRTASGERAGRAVEDGIGTFAKNVRATRKALYWQADRHIPETTPLPLAGTQRVLTSLTTPVAGAAATTGGLISPRIKKLADDIATDLAANNGSMPYGAVKSLRSKIGEALDDASPLIPDSAERELKALYGGLSQDMEAAASRLGSDATNAMKRANTYTRTSADRLKDVERVIDREGGPEKVFNAVMAGTKDGGTTLRKVMQSLPKEGQQAVTAAVIKRMGLANAGVQDDAGQVFSSATFLTNWNKVSPEAKRALFDRHGPQFAADMDKIAKVANSIRDGSKVFQNPSGTANKTAAYGYWISLLGSIGVGNYKTAGALALGGIAANRAAKAMTNPQFVRWLAKSTDAPVEALPGQLTALQRTIEKSGDDETAEIVADLRDKVSDDLYGRDGEHGLEIDLVGGRVGPAPTAEEMTRLRAGLVR